MGFISDGLLAIAAISAAVYCFILSRRVRALSDLDSGIGSAIHSLSSQVEGMRISLAEVKRAAAASENDLVGMVKRAEKATKRLELLLAAIHEPGESPQPEYAEQQFRTEQRPPVREVRLDEPLSAREPKSPSKGDTREQVVEALRGIERAMKR